MDLSAGISEKLHPASSAILRPVYPSRVVLLTLGSWQAACLGTWKALAPAMMSPHPRSNHRWHLCRVGCWHGRHPSLPRRLQWSSRRPRHRRIQILRGRRQPANRHRLPRHGSNQIHGVVRTQSSRKQQPEPKLSKVARWVQCVPTIRPHRVAVGEVVGVAAGVVARLAVQLKLHVLLCPYRVCQLMMRRLSALRRPSTIRRKASEARTSRRLCCPWHATIGFVRSPGVIVSELRKLRACFINLVNFFAFH